jgi:hypothetical protein
MFDQVEKLSKIEGRLNETRHNRLRDEEAIWKLVRQATLDECAKFSDKPLKKESADSRIVGSRLFAVALKYSNHNGQSQHVRSGL